MLTQRDSARQDLSPPLTIDTKIQETEYIIGLRKFPLWME
jgi:hypothetical protein